MKSVSEKCWAAVLYGPEDMRFEQIDIPEIGPYDILVQVRACGICGSDLHGYLGAHPSVVMPRIMGHEFSGVIAELGKEVKEFRRGDRVVCDNEISCGSCEQCLQGNPNICSHIKTIGFTLDGAYCEYVKVPHRNVYSLPGNVSFEDATLVQTLGVAYNSVKRAEISFNDWILIMGCGPIGLSVLILARAAGARLIVADMVDYRLDKARELGADVAVNTEKEDLLDRVMELTKGRGADRVIEAVGGSQDVTIGQCIRSVKRGGLVVLVGTFAQDKATLPATLFKDRQIELRGSKAYAGWKAFPELVSMIAEGKIAVSAMITHRMKLVEVEKGLKMMKSKEDKVVKVVVSP